MKIKKESIIAIFFIIFIFFMSGTLLLSKNGFLNNMVKEFEIERNKPISKIEKISNMINKTNITLDNNIRGKKIYINIHGLVQKLLMKNEIYDQGYGTLYRTKSGQITFSIIKKDIQVDNCTKKIIQLKKETDKIGVPILYVQAPFKLSGKKQQLYYGKKDYSDYNVNKFLKNLKKSNIDYLDLRENLIDGEKTQNELFYNTDHHWKIETAFDATRYLQEHLNKNYKFDISDFYCDKNNYNYKTYKKSFLGSMGRRVGSTYSGLDDFTLITPRYKTNITLTEKDYSEPNIKNGNFSEAVLNKKYLKHMNIKEENRYAVYHGDNRELIFKNNLVKKGKILFVKDSFGIPVYSFMSLRVNEVRALDLRLFKDSLIQYINDYKPEVVIILYNGDTFSDEMFEFK